jgi:hypothetical protein
MLRTQSADDNVGEKNLRHSSALGQLSDVIKREIQRDWKVLKGSRGGDAIACSVDRDLFCRVLFHRGEIPGRNLSHWWSTWTGVDLLRPGVEWSADSRVQSAGVTSMASFCGLTQPRHLSLQPARYLMID